MKISRIEVQKKNKKRSSIFINGEFKFGLTTDIVIKYGLEEGDEITEEDVKNLLLAEEKEYLKERAYRLLRYRNRSIAEMKDRLIKLGYEPDIIEMIINELKQEGALDDRKFVKGFASDYTELKPKGNIFIRRELQKKKVDQSLIEEIIKERDEKNILKTILQKKFPNYDKNDLKQKAKIIRYFLGKGFTVRTIYEVLGEEYE